MREVVTIHLGTTGVNIGSASWDVLRFEHYLPCEDSQPEFESDLFTAMFSPQSGYSRYSPRALFIDSNSPSIDAMKNSSIGSMLSDHQLISGGEDSGGVFARGRNHIGRAMLEHACDGVSKLVEACSTLQGFMVVSGVGGGTGSGLTDLLLTRLKEDFPKKMCHTMTVFPDETQAGSVVEPYNTVLGVRSLAEADFSLVYDNAALTRVSEKQLGILSPQFSTLNEVMAQAFSALTASLRFSRSLGVDMPELSTMMVPCPRIHFCQQTLSPLYPASRPYYPLTSVYDIGLSLVEPPAYLSSCDLTTGKFMATCYLGFRGAIPLISLHGVTSALRTRSNLKFADWSSDGFRCWLTPHSAGALPLGDIESAPKSAHLLANSTAIRQLLDVTLQSFKALHRKRAFLHWFAADGTEAACFTEAEEYLQSLVSDYYDCEIDLLCDDPE